MSTRYKWVRFKGNRWEIVELVGKPKTEYVLRMYEESKWDTKLIVEYGPGVDLPKRCFRSTQKLSSRGGWTK